MKLLFLTLTVLALNSCPLAAQQQDDNTNTVEQSFTPKYIIFQIEYIEVDHQFLTSMFEGEGILKSATTHRTALQKLIVEDKAKLVESSILTTKSGDGARIESVRQFIYPTEYDPAEIPEADKNGNLPKGEVATGPTATAFDERPIGIIVDMSATILPLSNNKFVTVELSPEILSYEGQTTWATWKDQFGEANISMPKFYNLSMNMSVTLKHNRYHLLGVHSPKDDKGVINPEKKLIVFARALIKTAGQ